MTRLLNLFASAKPKPRPVVDPVDEEDADEETRKKRHRHWVLAWALLLGTTRDRLSQLVDSLDAGRLTVKTWADAFREELQGSHAEAALIGRRLAGDATPLGGQDVQAGLDAWRTQEKFFADFIKDIEDGRYGTPGDDFQIAQVMNRSRMYAQRMKGTVNENFKEQLAGTNLAWRLGDAEHCDEEEGFDYTCEELAAMPPKPAEDWETAPGASDTPCRVYCSCYLETEDGKYSTEGI